ncbi:hypothetical protein SAMN05444365_101548 [Micromonospora pattaloongensis]|uniref:Uncharacterized protein n=1 Tax=Micromonospora pattaloongensis TaxID=405436 RepID=A0A1H3GUP6_9ACTN|nr:hypothetical protein [Micromonospora pattaloongensis]SDY06368.1 hypothetical protein SAMN05444365_101548 [Micromonospora pattaloongensis]
MPVQTLHQHLKGGCRLVALPAAVAVGRDRARAHSHSDGAGSRGPAALAGGRAEEGQ